MKGKKAENHHHQQQPLFLNGTLPQTVHPLFIFAFGPLIFLQIGLDGFDGIGDGVLIHFLLPRLFLHETDGGGVVGHQVFDADVRFRRVVSVAAPWSAGVDLITGAREGFFATGWWIALKDGTRLVRIKDEKHVLASAGIDQVVEDYRILDVDQVKETRMRRVVGLGSGSEKRKMRSNDS